MWMLWKLSGYYANLEFVHYVAVKKDKHTLMQLIQKRNPKELFKKSLRHFYF